MISIFVKIFHEIIKIFSRNHIFTQYYVTISYELVLMSSCTLKIITLDSIITLVMCAVTLISLNYFITMVS